MNGEKDDKANDQAAKDAESSRDAIEKEIAETDPETFNDKWGGGDSKPSDKQ